MEFDVSETLSAPNPASESRKWVHHVIDLLDVAARQLPDEERAARCTILEAACFLRKQVDPRVALPLPDGRASLLAWQARKVRDYIDAHIADPILVADLSALLQWSESHFSRRFRLTFGETPHTFVLRRRVKFVAQYMLETDAPLSEIALRCGFADQAHLCKHFRQAAGLTPAAWRRVHKRHDNQRATTSVSGASLPATTSSPDVYTRDSLAMNRRRLMDGQRVT
jgi:AraC family transcriptional regulator